MIGSLRGTLLDRSAIGEVLVEVSGVGYRVTSPPETLAGLGDVGDEVFLHVHHHIREDGQQLYGFATRDEGRCFEALLGAHGVGPALALAILSVHQPDRLRTAVATDDIDALTLVPGVGRKTAARLLLELKSCLDVPELVGVHAATNGDRAPTRLSPLADVREALAGLGYGADEIRAAVADLPADDDADVAELIRAALQSLGVR